MHRRRTRREPSREAISHSTADLQPGSGTRPGPPRNRGAGRGCACGLQEGASRVFCIRPTRTYVIDTSVLLSDPQALRRFAEHDVVLPVVVITELEAKRHHSELGYFARTALRILDDLRITYGRLDAPVPVNDQGGTVHVELNHTDPEILPAGFRLGDNDSRILAVALNYAAEGRDVTLVSKDLPMRVKASAVGLSAEEYRAELAVESEWTGMAEVDVAPADLDRLYEHGHPRPGRRPATCPATPGWCCSAARHRRWAG